MIEGSISFGSRACAASHRLERRRRAPLGSIWGERREPEQEAALNVEGRHQFRGNLAEQPLAEILYKIYRHRVPGVIEAVRGDDVKRVFLRGGYVVGALSSDLSESLGHYLLNSGRISREDFRRTMRERRASGKRYGALLVEAGLLSPADLHAAVQEQMAEILWNLFSWTAGQITFNIGEFSDPVPVLTHIPLRQAIKEGVKRMPDARELLSRIGGKQTRLEICYELEDLVETCLDSEEYELISSVDQDKTLIDLCTGGPFDIRLNGLLLYSFWVLKLVRRIEGTAKPSSGSIKIRLSTGQRFTE